MNTLQKILRENADKRVAIIGTICLDINLMKSIVPEASNIMSKLIRPEYVKDEDYDNYRKYPFRRNTWFTIKEYAKESPRTIKPGYPMYGTLATDCDVVVYLDADIPALKQLARTINESHSNIVHLDSEVRMNALMYDPIVINIRDIGKVSEDTEEEIEPARFENLADILPVIPLCENKVGADVRSKRMVHGYDDTFKQATWFAVNRLSKYDQEVLYIRGVKNKWPEDEKLKNEVAYFLPKLIDSLVEDIEMYFAAIRVHNYFIARRAISQGYRPATGTFIEPDPDLKALNQCNWI